MVFLMVSEKLLPHVTTASGQLFRIVFEQHLKSILEICIHKLLRLLLILQTFPPKTCD